MFIVFGEVVDRVRARSRLRYVDSGREQIELETAHLELEELRTNITAS